MCTLDASRALQRDKALRTEAAHYRDLWKLMETEWNRKAQDRPLVADTISAFYTGVVKAPMLFFYTETIHDLLLDILLLDAHLQEIVKWILLLRIIA